MTISNDSTTASHTLMARLALEVFKLQGQLLEEGERWTRGSNLTGTRLRVLGVLVRNDGSMTVPQIAREMGLTRQSVQRLADVMAADGFVAYRDNPAHTRSRLLCLTDLGQQSYTAMAGPQRQSLAMMADSLIARDLESAIALLVAIGKNLDNYSR